MPNAVFGPLPSEALDVSSGQTVERVVGRFWSNPLNPVTAGFVAEASGVVADLNNHLRTPDWRIDNATGINDFGQICGVGTHSTMGGPRAVLLTP